VTPKLTVLSSPAAIGEYVTVKVEALLAARDTVVLGCPAGRTPLPFYDALARSDLDLGRLRVVMMDEFLDDRLQWIPQAAPHSCRGFAARHIPVAQIYTPEPVGPLVYEELIEQLGGIDLFVLALGATDGHVAFNPPGMPADSRTRIVKLSDETRYDNLDTFPFASIDDVPTHGISVGLDTITSLSRAVMMLAHGAHKAAAVRRTLDLDAFDDSWPASVIYNCANAEIVIDQNLRDSSGFG
jgi:glucosamine-6-phosphate deaminase